MDWLYLIGRLLFGLLFVGSGFGHFGKAKSMSQYAAAKGLPAPKVAVIVSGFMLLAGGLSVILGVWMEIGIWLIVVFLLMAALMMHDFWAVSDPGQRQIEQAMFMKNIALAGAALVLYWVIQTQGYGPLTLGQPI